MNLKYSILEDLCKIYSPSGYENNMVKYIVNLIKDNINFDYLISNKNSIYVYNKNIDNKLNTIMIDTHIDQVFLKIINIINDGTVIALPIGFSGNITDSLILIHIKSGKKGTVNTNPPHLNIERRISDEVYIDFGLSFKEANKTFEIGDYIMFNSNYQKIGENNITGTGLDNKTSVFILLELINKFKIKKEFNKIKYNIIFNFSSREETGLSNIGLLLSNNSVFKLNKINEIITLDTIFETGDNEIIDSLNINSSIIFYNMGPVITRNSDDDLCFGDSFILLGDENKIKLQIAFTGNDNGGSNNEIYSKYTDSYTQFIGIPIKHMHNPNEMVSINDIKNTFTLLYKYLTWGDFNFKQCNN